MNPLQPCPCGSTRLATSCCAPYLSGDRTAPTAEALMRSRYVAYVIDRRDHLLASWHHSTRPSALPPPEPGLRWLGLQVMRASDPGSDQATVEFVARSKLGGRAHRLHETSRFVREAGCWYYVDGVLM